MRPREGKTTIEPHDGGRSVHADKQSLSTQSMRHQDDFTYQAAPQLSYDIYFILEQRLVLRFLLGTRSQSSHIQHIKDCDPPAFLALGFYMTSRVFVDSNGIMLTIGTFQVSGLLLGNGNSCPADFFDQLRRRFLNPNGCSLHYHTSNGSTYSLNGRSTM